MKLSLMFLWLIWYSVEYTGLANKKVKALEPRAHFTWNPLEGLWWHIQTWNFSWLFFGGCWSYWCLKSRHIQIKSFKVWILVLHTEDFLEVFDLQYTLLALWPCTHSTSSPSLNFFCGAQVRVLNLPDRVVVSIYCV